MNIRNNILLCIIGGIQAASIIDIDDEQIREASREGKSFGLHTSLGKSDCIKFDKLYS